MQNILTELFSRGMLPLDEHTEPVKVITAQGVQSYEEFGKDILTRFHQHGTTSPLMGVLGKGGKPSRDWSEGAAETYALEQDDLENARQGEDWDVPMGVVRENFGQTVQPEIMSEDERLRYARRLSKAHKSSVQISSQSLADLMMISSRTVAGLVPQSLR